MIHFPIEHSKTTIENCDINAVKKCLKSGYITSGKVSDLFIEQLRTFFDIPNVGLFSSGTSAFYTILKALDIKHGDEVLLPNYICSSLLKPISLCNAIPVPYDNEKDSWISSFDKIYSKITAKTKLIIVNHTFGIYFSDIDKVIDNTHVSVIEDCSNAIVLNSTINNRKISAKSLCSFYSFNATKLLATGEGGAIATHHGDFFRKINQQKIDNGISDLCSSLGISQLERYNVFLKRRNEIAKEYFKRLPSHITNYLRKHDSLYFRFPVWVEERHENFFNDKILFKKGVDSLLSDLLRLQNTDLVESRKTLLHTLSLPIYPLLKQNELNLIIKFINQKTKK